MAIGNLLGKASLRVAEECGAWIRDHSVRSADIKDFWRVIEPLMKALTQADKESLAWVTASVMQGPKVIFHPIRNNGTIGDEEWLYRKAIARLGERGKILHTTEMCLSVLRDGRMLQVHSHRSSIPELQDEAWHLDVRAFTKKLTERREKVGGAISELCREECAMVKVHELDDALGVENSGVAPILLPPNDAPGQQRTLWPIVGESGFSRLYRYVALSTAVFQSWSRITMLPTLFPTGHLSYPGGLVICEQADEAALSIAELRQLQAVASIAYWPWLLTARSSDENELLPTLGHILQSVDNDYRRLEHLFGGKCYTLIDKPCRTLDAHNFDGADSYRRFIEESTPALEAENGRSAPITEGSKEERRVERSRRLNNIRTSPLKISVLVPLKPDQDRLNNLGFLLRALDAQSLYSRHPGSIELVIVIDGHDYTGADKKAEENPILEMVKSYENLSNSPLRVIQRTTAEPLGRSSARNVGLEKCMGEVVQLLDDSMVLHPEYLLEILVRFEHLRGQKIAVLGFKERLAESEEGGFIEKCVSAMIDGELRPASRLDWKCSEVVEEGFAYAYRSFAPGESVNYMDLTGDLCFLSGGARLGNRSLAHFFTTGLTAALREELKEAGGFHPRFDTDWGLEDTFTGSVLVARGNDLVPCYSARAFDLQHEKDPSKKQLKSGKVDKIPNQKVYDALLQRELREFSRQSFEDDVAAARRCCEVLFQRQ